MKHNRYPIGRFKEIENPTEEDIKKWIGKIQKTPQLLKETLKKFNEQELELTFSPGGWTIRQIVHHIADNDMNAYFRVKRTLTEDNPVMPSYNQEQWAELGDYKEPVIVSINLITASYQRLIAIFKELNRDQFKRSMTSETYGTMNLEIILQRLLWHDRHHIAQINMVARKKGK